MKPFFRPSCLTDEGRFIAWHLGLPNIPTPAMKRGTVSEQIAMRGTLAVAPEWEMLPSELPENRTAKMKPDGTYPRFQSWDKWSAATGIDHKAENAIDANLWEQAVGAAKAIRCALPDEFQWQVSGSVEVGTKVPDGFLPSISGTCDLLLPEAVMDIKVVSDANEWSLIRNYRLQVSAYCHMHKRDYGAILAVFPIDKEERRWSSKIVQIEVMPMEAIEDQCQRLAIAYRRAIETAKFQTDLEQPLTI